MKTNCPECQEQTRFTFKHGELYCQKCDDYIEVDSPEQYLEYVDFGGQENFDVIDVSFGNGEFESYGVYSLGKGAFSVCFVDMKTGRVISFCSDDSKNAMSDVSGIDHLPEIEFNGRVKASCDTSEELIKSGHYYMFTSKLYQKVTEKNEIAWGQMTHIISTWLYWLAFHSGDNYDRSQAYLDYLMDSYQSGKKTPLTLDIIEAMEMALSSGTNYSQGVTFDFHHDNFGLDNDGNLILIDPIALFE